MRILKRIKASFVPFLIFGLWLIIVFLIVRSTMLSVELNFTNFRWENYKKHLTLHISQLFGFSDNEINVEEQHKKYIKSNYKNNDIGIWVNDHDDNSDWNDKKSKLVEKSLSDIPIDVTENNVPLKINVDSEKKIVNASSENGSNKKKKPVRKSKVESSMNKGDEGKTGDNISGEIEHDPNNAKKINAIRHNK